MHSAVALQPILCRPSWFRSFNQHERSHHQKKYSLLRDVCGTEDLQWIEQQQYETDQESAHVSTYAPVCMCARKGQWGQYWHAIFWAHGAAAAAKLRVLHFLRRPPLCWPASAHCHPDSTSVSMLKPLLLLSSSRPKDPNTSFTAVNDEKNKSLLGMFPQHMLQFNK